MSICLNMIVKNEAGNLKRLFATLHLWIDYYVISDTGSVDNTIETIKELGQFYNIQGVVRKDNWLNFEHNRNLAFKAAIREKEEGKCNFDWILLIDADEELMVIDEKWKAKLVEGINYTTYKKVNGIAFKHPFLIWINGQNIQWGGEVHNYLVNVNVDINPIHLNEVYILYHQFEGAKSHQFSNSIDKNKADINILLKELSSSEITKFSSHPYFQLAYSYKNINDLESAIYYLNKIINYKEASPDLLYISNVFIGKYLIVLKRNY